MAAITSSNCTKKGRANRPVVLLLERETKAGPEGPANAFVIRPARKHKNRRRPDVEGVCQVEEEFAPVTGLAKVVADLQIDDRARGNVIVVDVRGQSIGYIILATANKADIRNRVEAVKLVADRRIASPFRLRVVDIAGAIDSGRPPAVDVNEALLSLALVKAIYRSSELHAPVLIDDI